jgi:hypothetical protein
MNQLRYALYSMAAALMAAGESLKASADNVPADGVATEFVDQGTGEISNTAPPALDSAGLPWDERIHASTKTIKADGTWTMRKGVAETTKIAVTTELRAKHPAPTATATPATGGVTLPGALTTPGVPGSLPPVIAKLTKYQELCAFLAANTGAGKPADDAWVNAAFAGWNTTLAALQTAEEPTVSAYLAEFKKALGVA